MIGMSDVTRPDESIADFVAPPVAEVVASVRFDGLRDSTMFTVGSLWSEEFEDSFPAFSLQPPYDMPVEEFKQPQPGFNMQFGSRPPLPRVWLSAGDGRSEVMQIQQDWFALNWRKVSPSDQYDHWMTRRQAFQERWSTFTAWAASKGDVIAPNHFEVTYINHITPIPGVWMNHSEASEIFQGISLASAAGNALEQFVWNARFVLESDSGEPIGRLHVSAEPGFVGNEPTPVVILNITARGKLAVPGDLLGSLDLGRSAIVRTFLEVTSAKAKAAWGEVGK